MAESRIGLFVRIPAALRDRLESGRLLGYQSRPLAAPSTQAFVESLLASALEAHELAMRSVPSTVSAYSWGMPTPSDQHRSGGDHPAAVAFIASSITT